MGAGKDNVLIGNAAGLRNGGTDIFLRIVEVAEGKGYQHGQRVAGLHGKGGGVQVVMDAEGGAHGGVALEHGAKRRGDDLVTDADK